MREGEPAEVSIGHAVVVDLDKLVDVVIGRYPTWVVLDLSDHNRWEGVVAGAVVGVVDLSVVVERGHVVTTGVDTRAVVDACCGVVVVCGRIGTTRSA